MLRRSREGETERVATLIALELASPRRCAVVSRLLDNIDRGRPERRRLAALAAEAKARTGAEHGLVTLLTADGGVDAAESHPLPEAQSYCKLTLTGRPVVVPDSLSFLLLADNPHRHQVRSYLGAPIRVDDAIVGTLCVYGSTPRRWTGQQEATLVELAMEAAVALDA